MPDHRETYNTWLGLVFSIFSFIAVLSYAAYKLNSLVSRDLYTLQQAEEEGYYAYDMPFTEGFKVAAAITLWDGDPNPIEDPTIGELKFMTIGWDTLKDEDKYEMDLHWLEDKYCDESDRWVLGG